MFHLVGTGDKAAVVIGKHNNWLVLQLRTENSLTGDVKVVAVDEKKGRGHIQEHTTKEEKSERMFTF